MGMPGMLSMLVTNININLKKYSHTIVLKFAADDDFHKIGMIVVSYERHGKLLNIIAF